MSEFDRERKHMETTIQKLAKPINITTLFTQEEMGSLPGILALERLRRIQEEERRISRELSQNI